MKNIHIFAIFALALPFLSNPRVCASAAAGATDQSASSKAVDEKTAHADSLAQARAIDTTNFYLNVAMHTIRNGVLARGCLEEAMKLGVLPARMSPHLSESIRTITSMNVAYLLMQQVPFLHKSEQHNPLELAVDDIYRSNLSNQWVGLRTKKPLQKELNIIARMLFRAEIKLERSHLPAMSSIGEYIKLLRNAQEQAEIEKIRDIQRDHLVQEQLVTRHSAFKSVGPIVLSYLAFDFVQYAQEALDATVKSAPSNVRKKRPLKGRRK